MDRSGSIILLILIALGIVFTGSAVAGDEENSPETGLSIWDFGILPQKSEVSHRFWVHNIGTEALTVTKIKSGCSCTSVSEVEEPISPGDSAAVVVTFKSGRYLHAVQKTTKVYVNNGKSPAFKLRISAWVIKDNETTGDISVEPRKLKWPREKDNPTVKFDSLTISNFGNDTLTMSVVHLPDEVSFDIGTAPLLTPGETTSLPLQMSLQFDGTKPEGRSITLAFVGRDTTVVTVPIEVEQ